MSNATFPNYYRNEEEIRAGFADPALGLTLRTVDWRQTECPFGRGKGTPAELVGTVRSLPRRIIASVRLASTCSVIASARGTQISFVLVCGCLPPDAIGLEITCPTSSGPHLEQLGIHVRTPRLALGVGEAGFGG